MKARRIVIVGGGAAGFFAALACAEAAPDSDIQVLERGPQFLSKVRISGGGRCNVTHALFDEREFAARYPRGEHELIAPFKRFQARDMVAWFAAHDVPLKTERDGRMFPATDSSQTVIDCFINSAINTGIKLRTHATVEQVVRRKDGFEIVLAAGREGSDRECIRCDRLLIAVGGCRTPATGQLAADLGHTLESPVPSLFTFHIETPWLRELAGVSVEDVEVDVPGAGLCERGALLITHWGLSGPAILRLSAWGARRLHQMNYHFPLRLKWLPRTNAEKLATELQSRRTSQPARLIVNSPAGPLSSRLWEKLVLASGITARMRWSELSRSMTHRLIEQLQQTEFSVTGKSLNKEEFVTCGGVRLSEINFKTMESRICPGLFFAGEILDIDGITGGFNFQAAWTTGWIAGRAMAGD